MTPEHWSWWEAPSGDPRSAWQRYPGRRGTCLGTNPLREGNSADTSDTEIILIIQLLCRVVWTKATEWNIWDDVRVSHSININSYSFLSVMTNYHSISTWRQEMSCMRMPDILSPIWESSQSSSLGCFSHSYRTRVCRTCIDTGLPCS